MSARNVVQTRCPTGRLLLSREQVPHVPHGHREATLSQVVDDALLVLPCPAIPIRIPAGATNVEVVARDEALRGVALAREARFGRHEGASRGNVDCNSPRSLPVTPGGVACPSAKSAGTIITVRSRSWRRASRTCSIRSSAPST